MNIDLAELMAQQPGGTGEKERRLSNHTMILRKRRSMIARKKSNAFKMNYKNKKKREKSKTEATSGR